jgi:hypothetical protein
MSFTLRMRQLLRHVCHAVALITWLQAHDSYAHTGDGYCDTSMKRETEHKTLLNRTWCTNIWRDDVLHTTVVNKI